MITIPQNRASIERFDSLLSVSSNMMVFLLPNRKLTIVGHHLDVYQCKVAGKGIIFYAPVW